MTSYQTILVDKSEGIQTITFNRPDRLNALNGQMLLDTIAALDDADADDAVRVIIFTGAGRGFCAGADLGGGGTTFDHSGREQRHEHRDGGGLLTLRIFECKKPMGFNAAYLLEILKYMPTDEIRLTFKAPERAATCEPGGWNDPASYVTLVMPLRLVD